MAREFCEQCRFDSDLYDVADTVSSQSTIASLLGASFEGVSADVLARRPNAETWSIAEYVDHVREVAFGNRFVIESALQDPGVDLGDAPVSVMGAEAKAIDIDAALDAVANEYKAIGKVLSTIDAEQWKATAVVDGETKSVGWFARHVLHDGLHHLADIGRIRAGFGFGANQGTGTVSQISMSGGGVPKQAVDSADIGPAGLNGDAQNDRRHHGRPVQAVCLWSADVIAALAADGHPIAAGNAGENITVAGIDWASLHPGSRLVVGTIPMIITAHAIPCAKNAQWFSDRDFGRILHDRNPGLSRLYAIPLATGTITTNDPVIVEP